MVANRWLSAPNRLMNRSRGPLTGGFARSSKYFMFLRSGRVASSTERAGSLSGNAPVGVGELLTPASHASRSGQPMPYGNSGVPRYAGSQGTCTFRRSLWRTHEILQTIAGGVVRRASARAGHGGPGEAGREDDVQHHEGERREDHRAVGEGTLGAEQGCVGSGGRADRKAPEDRSWQDLGGARQDQGEHREDQGGLREGTLASQRRPVAALRCARRRVRQGRSGSGERVIREDEGQCRGDRFAGGEGALAGEPRSVAGDARPRRPAVGPTPLRHAKAFGGARGLRFSASPDGRSRPQSAICPFGGRESTRRSTWCGRSSFAAIPDRPGS